MKVNPEISAIAVIVFSTAMAQINYKEIPPETVALSPFPEVFLL